MGCDMIAWSATHCRKSVLGLGHRLQDRQMVLLKSKVRVSQKDVGILGQQSGVALDDLPNAFPGLRVYGSGFVAFFPSKSLQMH